MTVTTETEAYRRALDLEPDLLPVERMVHALVAGAPTDRPFCSSCLWEDILKPLVAPLVGWERAEIRPDAEPVDSDRPFTSGTVSEILDAAPARPEPSTPEETWLRTSEAYDAATDPLLAILDAADPGLGHGYPGKVRS